MEDCRDAAVADLDVGANRVADNGGIAVQDLERPADVPLGLEGGRAADVGADAVQEQAAAGSRRQNQLPDPVQGQLLLLP
jgi:hypothetical protein